MIYEDLLSKKSKIVVIGLGYVGLPIALELAKFFRVIGFDINSERVSLMQEQKDPSQEVEKSGFEGKDITFTNTLTGISDASFYIVAVPTPIDTRNQPNLTPVLSASQSVGEVLKKGDYVVFESTVYPGCTEEDCVPVLEKASGLKFLKDFKVGYSPERINPGDKVNTLTNVVKVVSGGCKESLKNIAAVYSKIIKAGVFEASSIKVAESAKIIENTQRDVNIALINELSIIFNRLGVNTYDVLKAAATKWNFLNFHPGLVGGHCIGVDPYYLSYKAKEYGYHAQLIDSGRFVNDSMGGYVAKQTVKKVIALGKHISESKILVMGATFKENVSDIRNSKVSDVVKELKSFGAKVEVTDPNADSEELKKEYGFEIVKELTNDYDAVIIAVNHQEYLDFDENYFSTITNKNPVIVDLKGIYRDKIKTLAYWSL